MSFHTHLVQLPSDFCGLRRVLGSRVLLEAKGWDIIEKEFVELVLFKGEGEAV